VQGVLLNIDCVALVLYSGNPSPELSHALFQSFIPNCHSVGMIMWNHSEFSNLDGQCMISATRYAKRWLKQELTNIHSEGCSLSCLCLIAFHYRSTTSNNRHSGTRLFPLNPGSYCRSYTGTRDSLLNRSLIPIRLLRLAACTVLALVPATGTSSKSAFGPFNNTCDWACERNGLIAGFCRLIPTSASS
jgi:hypothetical protein